MHGSGSRPAIRLPGFLWLCLCLWAVPLLCFPAAYLVGHMIVLELQGRQGESKKQKQITLF